MVHAWVPRKIECASCGAPVPLREHTPTPCLHCRAWVDLSPEHVALHAANKRAERHLRAADAFWRTLPRKRSTRATAMLVIMWFLTIFIAVLGWARFHTVLPVGPGLAFVSITVLPVLAVFYLGLEWLAYGAPWERLTREWSAVCNVRYPEAVLCRICGSALDVTPDSIFCRCAYCSAANLVTSITPRQHEQVVQHASRGRAQIDDAIAAVRMLVAQRTMVRVGGLSTTLAIAAFLTLALWNR